MLKRAGKCTMNKKHDYFYCFAENRTSNQRIFINNIKYTTKISNVKKIMETNFNVEINM